MNETRWMIEKKKPSGGLSGMAFHVPKREWVPVSDKSASFPTRKAAEIYATEFGLRLGVDVVIVPHMWD